MLEKAAGNSSQCPSNTTTKCLPHKTPQSFSHTSLCVDAGRSLMYDDWMLEPSGFLSVHFTLPVLTGPTTCSLPEPQKAMVTITSRFVSKPWRHFLPALLLCESWDSQGVGGRAILFPGTMRQYPGAFLVLTINGEGTTGMQGLGARDATKHC